MRKTLLIISIIILIIMAVNSIIKAEEPLEPGVQLVEIDIVQYEEIIGHMEQIDLMKEVLDRSIIYIKLGTLSLFGIFLFEMISNLSFWIKGS